MREWKNGDRVECIAKDDADPVQIGDVGTVQTNSISPIVKWDVCRTGMGSENCWTMGSNELREAIEPTDDGWIPWAGGECPVPAYTLVEVRYDSGALSGHNPSVPAEWYWGEGTNIVAYRIVKPAEMPITMEAESALSTQEGGAHYKTMKIQPIEYIHANGLGFSEGTAIAYISRWRAKGGLSDLRKAIHTLELLIELEGKK